MRPRICPNRRDVKWLSASLALGELQDEVPRMPDQATTGLEQPPLETRQGPALDGDRQDQPTQQIAQIVSYHPEEQAHCAKARASASAGHV